jgi:hypothetical protein
VIAPSVTRAAELASRNAFFDHVLENALKPTRPATDAAPAFGREMLAFIEKNPDEVRAINER